MKVNLYRSDDPSHLILKVEAPYDLTEPLHNFLMQIHEVDDDTLTILEQNTIQFVVHGIEEEDYKDWKLSVINAVRELLTHIEEGLAETFLVTKQQLQALTNAFDEGQTTLLQTQLELVVTRKYSEKLLVIAGLSIIVALVALIVAIVGVLI